MQRTPILPATGATLAVLALVAHLWMLDAPMLTSPRGDVATVSEPPPVLMTGCPSGMGACRGPMPVEIPLVLLSLVALASLGRLGAGDRWPGPMSADAAPAGTERAPPRPCVPASVVLLE